ncbi:hypothetical protein [Pseudobacteriovorax antillogorgiicola]|uniref:Concanavalin A-like lectin/glucanases superfamily protein n=1 Tax=Pseudobacteriovorax antillogorgiicola TaxID=1513793 RepID=A0A1Y6CSU6_9BACT|nr:hypothetical protein [Pseudobacteriovorax antillogorgiicola]TCS45429.1 hypothetical protein EDD56_12840 [Pseudobacteriovorax antillogorgiicola]SMF74218.1 hypothetical protein SAMN06296036_12840 [Pseudobacteriovorax antillogorgiicola]
MRLILITCLLPILALSCGKKGGGDDTSQAEEVPVSGKAPEAHSPGELKSQAVDTDPMGSTVGSSDQEHQESPETIPDSIVEAIDQTEILGCTDPLAFNYDAAATKNDDSCVAVQLGCMDAAMFNFNPNANIDDGSCVAIASGCTDADAFNYNSAANTDDGSCMAKVMGCTDSNYIEFSPAANTDNGTCLTAIVQGCTDGMASNYDALANVDDGSCNVVAVNPADSLPVANIAGTNSSLSLGEGDATVSEGEEGILGGQPAYTMDGDDLLVISNSNTFNTGGPFYGKTFAVAFRTGSDVTSTQMIYEEGGAIRGVSLYISGGYLYYNIYNIVSDGGNAPWGPISVSVALEANTDYVATLLYDQSQGTLGGYLNGIEAGQATGVGILYAHSDGIGLGAVNSDTVFADGSVEYNGGFYFTGLIASFKYYNEAVSATKLDALHQEMLSTYLP